MYYNGQSLVTITRPYHPGCVGHGFRNKNACILHLNTGTGIGKLLVFPNENEFIRKNHAIMLSLLVLPHTAAALASTPPPSLHTQQQKHRYYVITP